MAKNKPILTRPQAPSNPTSGEGAPDLARKFMRENPSGKLVDPPEIVEGRENPVAAIPVPEGGDTSAVFDSAPEAAVEPVVEASSTEEAQAAVPGEADPSPASTPQAEFQKDEAAEKPAAEVKPAVEKPAPVEPQTPRLDLQSQYVLMDGSEPWTGEQILTRLQEAAQWAPKAEEADKFRALLGSEYAEAESRWKPTLERLAANPQRTAFLEQLLVTDDPDKLAYLQRSAEFYDKEVPPAQIGQPQNQAVAPQADPRISRFEAVANQMEHQLITMRANNERAQMIQRYPWLANNEKARTSVINLASQLYAQDEQAGKPLEQRRGLLDAMEMNKVFLDSLSIAASQQRPATIEPRPGVGAAALIPGTGPGSAGIARSAPPREYTGPADGAKNKFLEDFPD